MIGRRSHPSWPDWLILMSVVAAITFVPLVVYLRVEPLSPQLYGFWNGQRANFDFFSYYKARILVGLAAVALVGLVAGLITNDSGLRRLPRPAGILLACYAVMVVLSTWTSPFPGVALDGFPDRYEGALVLLAYLVMALASFAACTTPARAHVVITGLAVSAFVAAIVGLLQYMGADPLRAPGGQRLILPSAYQQAAAQLQYPVEARTVYSTLYHYNYVGSYTALVLPFLIALLSARTLPRPTTRFVGDAALPVGLMWLVSGSRGGLTGGVLALVVLGMVRRPRVRVRWLAVAGAAGALVVTIAAVDLATGGRVRARATSVAADLRVLTSGLPPNRQVAPLELSRIDGAEIHVKTPDGALRIRHDAGNLTFFDEEQHPLLLIEEGNSHVRIDDPRFSQVTCILGRINGTSALVLERDGYVLNFLLLESGIRLALKTGRAVSTDPVATLGFAGRETIGSARGYIWSRSLPLLWDTLLLGYGPDTFAMVFPQQDFSGKFLVYGTTDMLVDKVHNLFLQNALNTGALSALALAALFVWYLRTSVRIYARRDPADGTSTHAVGVACLAAVVGYLGAALFNDSVVSVAPVFWVLLGLGMRMNVESFP